MSTPFSTQPTSLTYRSIKQPLLPNKDTGYTGFIIRAALRSTQFILAICIAGIYGADLYNFTLLKQHAPASWIYAEIVALISVATCTLHCFVHMPWIWSALWDFIVAILWTAQAGYFGTVYLGDEKDVGEATGDESRMKAGVGIGLTCMLLWLASFVQGIVFCCQARRVRRSKPKRTDRTISVLIEQGVRQHETGVLRKNGAEQLPDYEDVEEGVRPSEKRQ